MNIRYLQSNLLKLHDDNILKFLTDLVMNDFQNINMYENDVVYKKGDRVYLQENDKHQVYQCIVSESSKTFIIEEWENILNVYSNEVMRVNNMVIKEETHIITDETVNGIITNLDFEEPNTLITIYCGMKRYVINHDFTVTGKRIDFINPFDVGDKVILELREMIGRFDRLVLQSTNGNNYEICVVDGELNIVKTDSKYFKREVYIKDNSANVNYRLFINDEDLCYETTTVSTSKNKIVVMGENNDKYVLEVINHEVFWSINN